MKKASVPPARGFFHLLCQNSRQFEGKSLSASAPGEGPHMNKFFESSMLSQFQHVDASLFQRDGRACHRFASLLFPKNDIQTTTIMDEILSPHWLSAVDHEILAEERLKLDFAERLKFLKSKLKQPIQVVSKSGQLVQRCFPISQLPLVLEIAQGRNDHYLSQNSFRWPQRRLKALAGITSAWVDLDCYKIGVSQEDALTRLPILCALRGVPMPTFVVNSGRGIYCKWLFDHYLPGGALPRWKHLMSRLIEKFAPLGADPQASDAARVLRVVGSTNGKCGNQVTVVASGDRYQFDDLANVLLPRPRLSISDRLAVKALAEQVSQFRLIIPTGQKRTTGDYSVWLFGVEQDILKLCGLRGEAMQGHRELAVHLIMNSRLARGLIYDLADFWSQATSVGRLVSPDPDFIMSLEGSLSSDAHRKFFYKYSKISIISKLQISDYELRELKFLSQKKSKNLSSKVIVAEKIAMARLMKEQGMHPSDIALEFGVNIRTAYRWLDTFTDHTTSNLPPPISRM